MTDATTTAAAVVADPCVLLRVPPESARSAVDEIAAGDAGRLPAVVDRLRAHGSFDLLPVALQRHLHADPFFQVEALRDGALHATTVLRLAADPGRVVAALLERPWSWWRHGRVRGWERRDDGGARFTLYPMWLRSPAHVGIDLEPAVASEDRETCGRARPKTVLAARFFGSFRGPGRYEIVHLPDGAVLRSVFDGVERSGFTRMMPASMVLDLHVRAESGRLRFPFPAGTGFVGLGDALA